MDKDSDTAIEMFVGGLVLDPNTQAPVVVLKDESGDVVLPIWIGLAEATSIASAIKDIDMPRPLTHDLMYGVLGQVGIDVQRVVITELKEATYFAELVLSHGDKAIILDSRPSDAIALALRASAPIYVVPEVLEQAKVVFSGESVPTSGGGDVSEKLSEEAEKEAAGGSVSQDFSEFDKEKWDELLAGLDPDDFKYKM